MHDMAWLLSAVDMVHRAAVSVTRPVSCFNVGGGQSGWRVRNLPRNEAERVEQQFPVGLPGGSTGCSAASS